MLRFWVIREINSRFCSKTQWQMFLLVSGRHVGAHVHGHQHGVSIQISINLGKTFLRISSIRKIAVTWILARVFVYLPSFYFQILDLIYWTVLIFYIDLFWMAWHWKPAIKTCYSETRRDYLIIKLVTIYGWYENLPLEWNKSFLFHFFHKSITLILFFSSSEHIFLCMFWRKQGYVTKFKTKKIITFASSTYQWI